MKIRRASSKGSAKFSSASHCDPFLGRMERAAQKGLSVRGAVMHIGNKGSFENCFVQKSIEFRVLLVHHNAPGHLQVLGMAHPNIQYPISTVTTAHLQPLNQAIVTTFQSYYNRPTFHFILDAGEESAVKVT